MRAFKYFLLASVVIGSVSMRAENNSTSHSTATLDQRITVWLTTSDQKNLVTRQPAPKISALTPGQNLIEVWEDKPAQEIDGFGANFSDLTAYLTTYDMSSEKRRQLYRSLFSKEAGAGFDIVRLSIGANDQVYDKQYNVKATTYDDNGGKPDYQLTNFSIAHDEQYLIPRLREAFQINPSLKVLATVWWQPSWLVVKDTQTCGVGNGRPYLMADPNHYDTYAQLLVKYIQQFSSQGIRIWAVEPQNEPQCGGQTQQNIEMPAEKQAIFIRDFLYPAFQKQKIAAGIIPNVDQYCDSKRVTTRYVDTFLKDPLLQAKILGTSWHGYCTPAASASFMSKVLKSNPLFKVYQTEVGYSAPYQWKNLTRQDGGSSDVIAVLRNGGSAFLWHALANSTKGDLGTCDATYCGPLLEIDRATSEVHYLMPYYVLEHFSRFLYRGSERLESTANGILENVAFRNRDGSVVLVVANTDQVEERSFSVKSKEVSFSYQLPPNSIATFRWANGD
jgi:glucosylceramidase